MIIFKYHINHMLSLQMEGALSIRLSGLAFCKDRITNTYKELLFSTALEQGFSHSNMAARCDMR